MRRSVLVDNGESCKSEPDAPFAVLPAPLRIRTSSAHPFETSLQSFAGDRVRRPFASDHADEATHVRSHLDNRIDELRPYSFDRSCVRRGVGRTRAAGGGQCIQSCDNCVGVAGPHKRRAGGVTNQTRCERRNEG